MWIVRCAFAISACIRTRASVDRPLVGELVATSASVLPPAAARNGKYTGLMSISPLASSQFSANVASSPEAASPSSRTIVSRHWGSRFIKCHHLSR
jgi:hypothetical protein